MYLNLRQMRKKAAFSELHKDLLQVYIILKRIIIDDIFILSEVNMLDKYYRTVKYLNTNKITIVNDSFELVKDLLLLVYSVSQSPQGTSKNLTPSPSPY
ncbi:MAG: hypothetical protein AAGM40_06685 [Cyanobacteria bacterium J06573_2]